MFTILTVLAVVATLCLLPVYSKARQNKISAAASLLRETGGADNMRIVGSYNAFHQSGERFRTYGHDIPATLDFNNEEIRIKVISKDGNDAKEYHYKRDNSEVLWIGNSGRFKDITEWILIKNDQRSSLLSAFLGTQYITTDWHTKNLYLKLDELGYATGVDSKRRGIVRQGLLSAALLAIGVVNMIGGKWILGVVAIILPIFLISLEFRTKQVPKRL